MLWCLLWSCQKDASDTSAEPLPVETESSAELTRSCTTRFEYRSQHDPHGVYVAGDFNDWDDQAHALESMGEDLWVLELELEQGAYGYKFVEKTGYEYWACDPEAEWMQCDPGYDGGSWMDCTPGASSCNSMVVVEDCSQPLLEWDALETDLSAGSVQGSVSILRGSQGAAVTDVRVTLDGEEQELDWEEGTPLELSWEGLPAGHHVLRIEAEDAEGRAAEELYLPFWVDRVGWEQDILYYAFVDRFHDGDSSRNGSEGGVTATDYQGGDWAGVEAKLDYLQSLGVSALWLTVPLDNAGGGWGDICEVAATGYHGYWPVSALGLEEHFGSEEDFASLVDEAHARGMRVMVDWVANHVHEDHPYVQEHPEWFDELGYLCEDYNNWNDIPETCWFDAFLPDVNYYIPEPSRQMVEDAIELAKIYELDGFRVDAVKHMPRAVVFNLQQAVQRELEYGGEPFYTVGETFDGDRGLLASYVGEELLDGQFDFPVYFTLRSAFIYGSATLPDLEASFAESQSSFSHGLMSNFLGNHDVERFISVAAEGDQGSCDGDGQLLEPASAPGWSEPYERMKLAWTWVMTHSGVPLIYYGDEIGLPGHQDPDNRQLMRFGDELSGDEASVLAHVQALGQGRQEHAQLALGSSTTWWEEDDLLVRALEHEGQWALVAIYRGWDERALSNGLSWAGMPEGSWRDLLSGDSIQSEGDQLSFTMSQLSSRVWIWEG